MSAGQDSVEKKDKSDGNPNENKDLKTEDYDNISDRITLLLGVIFGFLGGLMKYIMSTYPDFNQVFWFGPPVLCAFFPIVSPVIGVITASLVGLILKKTKISKNIKYIIISVLSFIVGAIPGYWWSL